MWAQSVMDHTYKLHNTQNKKILIIYNKPFYTHLKISAVSLVGLYLKIQTGVAS